MIDHLIDDYYKYSNGKLSKNPKTVILNLKLSSISGDKCYLNKSSKIYNPFILGSYNSGYKRYRKKSGDRCCFGLENTYEF